MKKLFSTFAQGMLFMALALVLTGCDEFFSLMDNPVTPRLNVRSNSITLKVGATASCEASTQDHVALFYASADPAVATVDAKGTITGVAVGKTKITVTAKGEDEYYRTQIFGENAQVIDVEVIPAKVDVTSIKLSESTLDKKVGDAAVTLTVTFDPDDATDKTVTWKSSNEGVAAVADGVVTFVAAGTATITATATNGTDDTADDKTAECAVTVSAVPVTGLTLDAAILRLDNTAKALTATVAPADATDKTVTWVSSNPSVATVDASGNVTPVAKGTATITATAADQTATSTVIVYDKIWNINTDGEAAVGAGKSWLIEGNGTAVANAIYIGNDATVTLNGINITKHIECSATATIILADGSINTITAPANKAGITVGATQLTIDAETAGTGKLTTTGGLQAAGIGSDDTNSGDKSCGNIIINGGTIDAIGGWGAAGIGTGYALQRSNLCGNITINGGKITATGGNEAAGIGTGRVYGNSAQSGSQTCGNITISAGVTSVTATKGTYGTNSIGKGINAVVSTQTCGTITIGGVVKAQSDFTGATYTYEP